MDCTSALATWKETTSGVAVGMPTATLSLSMNTNTVKVVVKLVKPTLETISGDASGYVAVPKIAYETVAKLELLLPARSTLQDRKDVKALLISMINNAVVTSAVEAYQRPY
jgi:hypothetical protein